MTDGDRFETHRLQGCRVGCPDFRRDAGCTVARAASTHAAAMTRNATEGLDAMQLDLNKKCEELLLSKKWNSTPVKHYNGVVKRLEMIKAAGLPGMRVVSAKKLAELGRIPRSDEGHQIDALEAVKKAGRDFGTGSPRALILFYSHRWKRPNWSESMQKDVPWGSAERAAAGKVGDPDDAAHSKALALLSMGEWFAAHLNRMTVCFPFFREAMFEMCPTWIQGCPLPMCPDQWDDTPVGLFPLCFNKMFCQAEYEIYVSAKSGVELAVFAFANAKVPRPISMCGSTGLTGHAPTRPIRAPTVRMAPLEPRNNRPPTRCTGLTCDAALQWRRCPRTSARARPSSPRRRSPSTWVARGVRWSC